MAFDIMSDEFSRLASRAGDRARREIVAEARHGAIDWVATDLPRWVTGLILACRAIET